MTAQDPIVHSRRYQFVLWSAALALIALGLYLTRIEFMNTEWLSRSGCLVVMLGIWSSLGVIIQERLILGRLRWRRRNAIVSATARLQSEPPDAGKLEKELGEINRAFDRQSAEITQRLKLSLGGLEVSLLLTGTFLWGFGDLLVR